MRIKELEPGTPFRLACNPDKRGILLRIGDSAVVSYGKRKADFTATVYTVEGGEQEKPVAFEAPGRPCAISLETEVIDA